MMTQNRKPGSQGHGYITKVRDNLESGYYDYMVTPTLVTSARFHAQLYSNTDAAVINLSLLQASIRSSPSLKRNSSLASSPFLLFPSLLDSIFLSALR